MSQIIIFPKGTLSAEDKQKAEEKGFLAIECDDPSKVAVITPMPSVAPEMMFMCALRSLQGPGMERESIRAQFAVNLYESLKAKEKP